MEDYNSRYIILNNDKKELDETISKINDILQKYSYVTSGHEVSTLNRAKISAKEAKTWINALSHANLTEENGMYVDYDNLFVGNLSNGMGTKVGFRVFDNSFLFTGLLDKRKVAVWNVDIETLKEYK